MVVDMLVKEIMVTKVISIDRDKTVVDACNMYRDHRVGCLLVMHQEDCVGIVTERDIIERTICAHRNPEQTTVGDIMSSDIKTVHALEKLERAVNIMQEHHIKKLPVLLKEEVVGIITVTDISRVLPELAESFIDPWVRSMHQLKKSA